MARLALPILFLMLILVQNGESIWMNLPRSGQKCVTEEVQNAVVVIGQYAIVTFEGPVHPNPTISITVKSPHGTIVHHKENATHGDFAFTTSESGSYLTCFSPDRSGESGELAINMDWKIGVAAKDWDSVAKKEKIDGVELELRKLEGAVQAIHENLVYLMGREEKMSGVSETTNSRVAWYSISSLGICILASSSQLWYLTRFFQKKKLI